MIEEEFNETQSGFLPGKEQERVDLACVGLQ